MKGITRVCLKLVQNLLPDAFILAVLLSLVVFGIGWIVSGKSFFDIVSFWGNGFSNMYVFGMQMVLVLITGYALALTPIMQKFLNKLTNIPKTPSQALMMTSLISILSCYISWSFGLVIGAILAKHMGRKVKGLHFPLLVAAAYGGEIIRGPSSSIPLVSATPGNFMTKMGIDVVPVSQTLYSSWNVIMSVVVIGALVLLFYNMRPAQGEIIEFYEKEAPKPAEKSKKEMTFAERLEHSYIINVLMACLPFFYLASNLSKFGFDLNLNYCIMIFLTASLLLHKDPMGFIDAIKVAIGASRGIVLQFPLYAGMSGIMVGCGLVEMISNWFVSISDNHTFPLYTFLSAGLVNIFIPSGGGQWVVQGPIMMKAASALGADIPQTIMAFAWGDGWTNQIQPFWALPLLGVAGLSARDIMGYCVIWTFISGVIICSTFILLTFL